MRWIARTVLFLALTCGGGAARAALPADSLLASLPLTIVPEPRDSSLLVVYGEVIPPPYMLVWDGTAVYVNGRQVIPTLKAREAARPSPLAEGLQSLLRRADDAAATAGNPEEARMRRLQTLRADTSLVERAWVDAQGLVQVDWKRGITLGFGSLAGDSSARRPTTRSEYLAARLRPLMEELKGTCAVLIDLDGQDERITRNIAQARKQILAAIRDGEITPGPVTAGRLRTLTGRARNDDEEDR